MHVTLGILAIVGVALTLGSLVWLHIVPTGLNPVRDAVSQYGISSHRIGYRVATISLGIAAIALGFALNMVLEPANIVALVFLLLFGLARLVISWVPMDSPDARRTSTGRAHNLLATVFFASATVAAFLYNGTFSADEAFVGIAGVGSVLSWTMAAASALVVVSAVVSALKPYFGALERLLYLAILTWMTIVAVAVTTA